MKKLLASARWGTGALGLILLGAPAAPAQLGSPAGPVPAERLSARRAALGRRIGNGVAVLRSASARSIEGDYPQDGDFRQDNDFFYLTGLETPGSWLVLVARADTLEGVKLYLPAPDSAAERWTGPQLGPGEEARRMTGIADISAAENAEAEIRNLVLAAGSPARTGRLYVKRGEAEGRLVLFRELVFGPELEVRDLRVELAALRLVKDADELGRLRRAVEITVEAQRQAMRALRPGVWEYELEALVEYTFRRRGAERLGFPSIVGSGPNSAILHYDDGRRQMQAGELVVVDVGAEFGYYSADVTRTLPVSGRFTGRQRRLYELVLGAQQAALDSVRPGATLATLNRIAREYLREHSRDLCGAQSCDRYFIHGLSHWLGMDVHDVGDRSTPLAPGMVLTVEPGIYLPDERLGIRIEDDVLVTAGGYELLSAGAPRRPEEIERLMHSARSAAPP
ncbi:MAG: aminopeptidase P family protein [Gemmatimonadetes bacterium]|nr:aminopeptidase P family protein [Gemmatimonadota bacterium]